MYVLFSNYTILCQQIMSCISLKIIIMIGIFGLFVNHFFTLDARNYHTCTCCIETGCHAIISVYGNDYLYITLSIIINKLFYSCALSCHNYIKQYSKKIYYIFRDIRVWDNNSYIIIHIIHTYLAYSLRK